jgi:hypothetical protein
LSYIIHVEREKILVVTLQTLAVHWSHQYSRVQSNGLFFNGVKSDSDMGLMPMEAWAFRTEA